MCGIAGKIYFGQQKVLSSDLLKMTGEIAHRGPEAEQIYVSSDKKIGLGFRRLAIVDLSPKAMQPMDLKKRYWIVFNGEVYNYKALKHKLVGYEFKSDSDTEVVLALYDKYGVKCLDYMDGMFSLAIYDDEKKTLFAARDRLGEKPFKYYFDDKTFIFSSELKSILTQSDYKREPDYMAINSFLTLQFVPSPLTGFKGIKKLEPGHYLFLDIKKKQLTKECYWQVDYSEKWKLTESDWKKKILETLSRSVEMRMDAEVPVGALLSGGVDSSAVVALMSRLSDKPIKTYSVGFGESAYDETQYARMISNKFGTEHHELIVRPESFDTLPSLVKHLEEPFADNSVLPTFLISELAKDEVTVVLTGDGGDENFGGYSRHSKWRILNKLKNFGWLSRRFKRDDLERYVGTLKYFDEVSKVPLVTDYYKKLTGGGCIFNERVKKIFDQNIKVDDKILVADLMAYLPDDMLVKMDMATMMTAVEARSPFLAREVVEMAARIPFEMKVTNTNNKKYILKETFRGILPNEVLDRPKMGFGMPLEKWFREDIKKYAEKTLLSKKAVSRGLFSTEGVKGVISRHMVGDIDISGQLWILLMLELWFEEYFD